MSDESNPPAPTHSEHQVIAVRAPADHGGRHVALVVLAAVVLAVAITLVSVAVGHSQSGATNTITVIGSGTAKGAPDTLSFQIGVNTSAYSATRALDENSARVTSLENALMAHGVTKSNLQTSGLNIYENTNNQGQVIGFSVNNTLNVVMSKIADAGSAIDAAAHAVGNGIQLNGVSFSISNDSALLATARAKAMQQARTEANQIAGAAHASVGSAVKITDQENSTPVNLYYPSYFRGLSSGGAVPIQAGTLSVSVQVTVVYALNS